MAKLDEARRSLAADPMSSSDDFRTTVLSRNDAVQGIARNALAKDFCRRRGVPGGAIRFNFSTYGSATCGILARAWCHKMQHYLNLEVVHPLGEGLVFGPEEHATYDEPSELKRLLVGDLRSAVLLRVRQIRGLMH